jgi:hypothetical protein
MLMINGQAGEAPWAITLAHGHPMITVTTTPRKHFDEHMTSKHSVPGWDFAWGLMFSLTEQAEPALSAAKQRTYRERANEFNENQATARASWPTCTWIVEDEPAAAHYFTFADRWAAYTTDLAEVYLSASGTTTDPSGLRFAVTDGSDYATDFSQPLDFPGSLIRSRAEVFGPDHRQKYQPPPMHPDVERLLTGDPPAT